MNIILIISFLMIAFAAGYLFKVGLSDSLPFVWCGIILVLYVLAFGRVLYAINWILVLSALGLFAYVLFRDKKGFGIYAKQNLLSAPLCTYIVLSLIIMWGVSDKIVTWWDDINYWASDLKSIYYLNGFAAKYANVSPGFGDYPPGVQLAKWLVVQTNKHEYKESLAFVGYYLFNFSLLMPLYKNLKGIRGVICSLPLALITWALPGVAEIYGYSGFCSDLSMALLFGNILIATVDVSENTNPLFDYLRISLYMAVLVISKSTGSIWAVLGLIVWIGYRLIKNKNMTKVTLSGFKLFSVVLAPVLVGGSWMLFCLLHRRVTQTTSTMVTYITTDKYGLSEYTSQFAGAFIKAFLFEPLHVGKSILNPSPAIMLLSILILLVLLNKKEYLGGKEGKFICIVLPLVGLLYYGIIFLAHITIFATETQYLESSGMIASIERYGAPFMLGVVIFISWVWLNNLSETNRSKLYINLGVFTVAVILLSNIPEAYKGLIGYRTSLEEDMKIRTDFVDEESETFLTSLHSVFPDGNVRVCRLRDGGYYRVADTYIAYEASPVSVMNISYDLNQVDLGTIIASVNQTHALYLYVDKQETLSDNILSECVQNGDFEYEKIYSISYEGGTMVLYPVG